MEMKRDNAIDLFRIIGSFFIVFAHLGNIISIRYFIYIEKTLMSDVYWLDLFFSYASCFFGNIALIFLLISGALSFKDYDTTDIKKYQKSIVKRFLKIILFVILLYFVIQFIYYYLVFKNVLKTIVFCIALIYFNHVSGHLWYIYVLFLLLLILPYLRIFKNKLDIKKYITLIVIVLCISMFAVSYLDTLPFGFLLGFLGYLLRGVKYLCIFLIGDLIYNVFKDDKDNFKAILFFIISFIICVLHSFIFNKFDIYDNPSIDFFHSFLVKFSHSNPFVILSSIFLFLSIKYADIKMSFMSLSSSTYFVYLFHPALIFLYYVFYAIIINKDINTLDIDINLGKLFFLALMFYIALIVIYKLIVKITIKITKPKNDIPISFSESNSIENNVVENIVEENIVEEHNAEVENNDNLILSAESNSIENNVVENIVEEKNTEENNIEVKNNDNPIQFSDNNDIDNNNLENNTEITSE